MMHANEHIDGISLAGGEAGERRRLQLDLSSVLDATRNIFRAEINLAWVQTAMAGSLSSGPFWLRRPSISRGTSASAAL